MKLNKWFVVGILIFLVLMFIVELQLPKNFTWNPTFRQVDKQPFGCYLFDSLLTTTMPKGYSVTDSSLLQLAKGTTTPRGILVVTDILNLTRSDVKSVMEMANKGSHVMLVAHSFSRLVDDTLGIASVGYGNTFDLQNYVKSNERRDTIYWVSKRLGYKPRSYAVFGPICTRKFRFVDDSVKTHRSKPIDSQASCNGYDVFSTYVSSTFQQGKGYITLCTVPLLFTNYGVVDQDNVGFSLRLLSEMKNLPVVRTEAYCPQVETEEQTPLRYFLSQPPLRWAIYTAMVGALLFLIFASRRRQRIIPIEKAPENHSLEFIHLVGTLYYHSRERRSLVVRKWTYFAEELRRELHMDVTDASDDDLTLPALARQTGMEEKTLRDLILRLRWLVDEDGSEISRKQMKQYIDQMNWIIKNI